MKPLLIVALAVVILIVVGVSLNYLLNSARTGAEQQLREQNPLFHMVSEGGSCRDAQGDCQGGLTCVNSTCQKP